MKATVALRIVGWVLLGACALAALVSIVSVLVMLLWNWLMPVISKGAVSELTYLQAVGFYSLCHLLFKTHHRELDHDGKKHDHPRLLARKIHGLLGRGRSEGRPAAAGE